MPDDCRVVRTIGYHPDGSCTVVEADGTSRRLPPGDQGERRERPGKRVVLLKRDHAPHQAGERCPLGAECPLLDDERRDAVDVRLEREREAQVREAREAKKMMNRNDLDTVLQKSAAVARGEEVDLPSPAECDEAMLALAKRERRDGESEEAALLRLVSAGDSRVSDLWAARDSARCRPPDLAAFGKREEARARAWAIIEKYCEDKARPGETVEKAFSRLLDDDEILRDAVAAYEDIARGR